MKNNNEMKWDKKAETYPRYTSSESTYEARVISRLEDEGINFTGKKVLDVGCGSGKFTIGIAKKAASVLGTDISSKMLSILHEDAEKEGADNIRSQKCDWESFESGGEKFDIVFASVTPAVRTEADFARVTELANECVVYIGWAGRKESEIMYSVYRACGIDPKPFNDVPEIKAWLDGQKIPYMVLPIEETWVRTHGRERAERICQEALEGSTCRPDFDEILNPFANADGTFTDRMHVKLEIIIW